MQYHLTLLHRFCALYEAVEATAWDEEGKARAVQQFLVCAESRYIHYLEILDDFIRNHWGAGSTLADSMPLPPWYHSSRLR
jgi:hypothetical protein